MAEKTKNPPKAKKPTPFGVSANPQPGFEFGTTAPTVSTAVTPAETAPAKDFWNNIFQMMQPPGAMQQNNGPDLGMLLDKIATNRALRDPQGQHNKSSQLPSYAAGATGNPWNSGFFKPMTIGDTGVPYGSPEGAAMLQGPPPEQLAGLPLDQLQAFYGLPITGPTPPPPTDPRYKKRPMTGGTGSVVDGPFGRGFSFPS